MVQQKKSLHLIQLLRGIASLLVVFLHATSNVNEKLNAKFLGDFFSFGGAGVDIFFVLSGFIITYTSAKGLANKEKLKPFIRKRIIRIYPTYWIIISGFLVLQILFPSFYRVPYDGTVNNFFATYLLLPKHAMVNGVSWTLTYEIYFYLLFSLGFLIHKKKWFFYILFAYSISIILLPLFNYNFENANEWIKLISSPMNIEFFMGVLAALVITKLNAMMAKPLVIIGSALFFVSGVLSNNGVILFNNEFNRVILFGIPSFLLIIAVVKLEITKKVEAPIILLLLGEASYSIYLIHLPVVAAATVVLAKLGISNVLILHFSLLIIIVIICVVGILFFKWVERPIIDKLNSMFSTT